jgi:membrane protein DedA with SNARE-associated domain
MVPDSTALYIYLGIFCSLLAAGLGFPIPEELPIIAAGAAVGHASVDSQAAPAAWMIVFGGSPHVPFPANLPWSMIVSDVIVPRPSPLPSTLRWWIMLPVCIVGAVTGDIFLYCMGRFGGTWLLENRYMRRLFPPQKRARTERNFQKYGALVLVFARFLPTIRSPIFIMSGITRVPFTRFLLADGVAGIFGVSLLFTLAFWFGDQVREYVERLEHRVHDLQPLLILLAITAVGTYLFYHFVRHPVATGDPNEEVPLVGQQVAAKISHPKAPPEKAGAPESNDHPDGERRPTEAEQGSKSV